ncbi:hypothetical protein crov089 [Cafeteria roenbergensis virus]|uniref:Uncharacterized protein n=1 Tax=Cafeteria roenbergensis virus (strain BV-PW1) TaxID=693272 RepID=E3T4K9_CROVB|nr:hypothetical protein crov089 [Cafeteria roenbergensis virus BV-PW1]ADO67122.1 hypothetical protein crov089 [Cafeteria roenbergensis virus BV-PW1]
MSLIYHANGTIVDKRIKEHFLGFLAGAVAGGLNKKSSTNIKNNTKINKAIENISNINREMIVDAINNINNKVSNQVAQKNTVDISNSMIAENKINFEQSSITGDFNVSGNTLSNDVILQTYSNVKQKTDNTIKTDISTEITKTIKNNIPNDNTPNSKLANKPMKELNDYLTQLKSTSQVPSNITGTDLVSNLANIFLPKPSTDTNITVNNELNESTKQILNLDDSFKVNDENNISNEISNIVDQANYSSCRTSVLAQNEMNFRNLDIGGSATISNNVLKNVASSYLDCVIDQDISNEISTKIVTKLESTIEKLVSAVAEKNPDKIPLLIYAADASINTIIDAAYPDGDYPEEISPTNTLPDTQPSITSTNDNDYPTNQNNQNTQNTQNNQNNHNAQDNQNNHNIISSNPLNITLYVIGSLILVLIIIIIIILFTNKKGPSTNFNDKYY